MLLRNAFSEHWQPLPLRLLGVSYSVLVNRRARYMCTVMYIYIYPAFQAGSGCRADGIGATDAAGFLTASYHAVLTRPRRRVTSHN